MNAPEPRLLPAEVPDALPAYLRDTYHWAYLSRRAVRWLDRRPVVSAILWGNAGRLMAAAAAEFQPGQRVLQAACVYGDFSRRLAQAVGPAGALQVVDVAPIQVANARAKLADCPWVELRVADLAQPLGASFDGVCCFFLLHEVPPPVRRAIVANLLAAVAPGGKVVFVDYHRPARWHPLGPLMGQVFRRLEPFAESLLAQDISTIAPQGQAFRWQRRTLFGGLYQVLVGLRGEGG